MKYFLMILMICVLGCKSIPTQPDEKEFEWRFQKTFDRDVKEQRNSKLVTVRFDDMPFGQAMGILTQETNVPIVWGVELDEKTAGGIFNGVPLSVVLDTLSRRCGVSFAEVGGVFYIGAVKREDRAFAVIRIPPVNKDEFLRAMKDSCSMESAVSVVGSCVWICDTLESLRKVCAAVEAIREQSERSYLAELYFIRVNEEHFVNLSARLQFKQIDIFSSAFNVEQLFEMFLDGDAATGCAKISQRPVLYLSEGRNVTFSDGREIVRERKVVTEMGVIETSGYERFSDGLTISMLLNRVSQKSYMVDLDMNVSVFDKNDKNLIPAVDRSSLKSEGLLVQDGMVYYVGSLKRDNRSDKGGLFSFDFFKSHDMFTIWLRVRELQGSLN